MKMVANRVITIFLSSGYGKTLHLYVEQLCFQTVSKLQAALCSFNAPKINFRTFSAFSKYAARNTNAHGALILKIKQV